MSQLELLQRRIDRERTARKTAESLLEEKSREVYKTNCQLRDLADRNNAILETAAEGIITYDSEGSITSFNRSARNIFKCESAIGRSIFELFQTDDDVGGILFPTCSVEGECQHQIISDSEVSIRDPIELVAVRDDGEAFAAEFSTSQLLHDSTTIYTAVLRDLTRRKELEARLGQAKKLESVGQLAAGIAHEINTPIQYIGDNTRFVQTSCDEIAEVLACCQALIAVAEEKDQAGSAIDQLREAIEKTDLDYLLEEMPAAIQQSLEGIEHVAKIVRAMKEFAHPGVSEMKLTDLSNSINNTVTVARNEWKYVADVVTDFDPQLPRVPCLPGELNQVLLNLVINAAHAIHEANRDQTGIKGIIKISTKHINDYAEIRISDSGIGIDPRNIEKIFTPFFTTKGVGEGTGQGLAIAHSVIVEKHSGTIDVESSIGAGTTFIIRLPLNSSDSQKESETNEKRPLIQNEEVGA